MLRETGVEAGARVAWRAMPLAVWRRARGSGVRAETP